MNLIQQIETKRQQAFQYSLKFNNNQMFYILSDNINTVLTNSVVVAGNCYNNGYKVLYTYENGVERKYV